MPEPLFRSDQTVIKQHLGRLFSAVPASYPGGLLEIRCLDPRREAPPSAALFECTQAGISEAAGYAAERNASGYNIYVGANPRKPSSRKMKAATDGDVEIAFVQFVDLDSGVDCRDRLEAGRIGPCFVVLTGNAPSPRLHGYWELDTPCRNLPAWTRTQESLAAWFHGDPVVKNPSRIVRLAGTMNFPDQNKVARGYRIERTGFELIAETDSGVPSDALMSVYGSASPYSDAYEPASSTGPAGLSDLLTSSSLLKRIRAGENWHYNMVRVVAHWIGRGWSNAEILAASESFTLPGYTHEQTRREVLQAVQGGRSKWGKPDEEEPLQVVPTPPELFRFMTIRDALDMPPPTWLIPGLITENSFCPLYGPSGSLKTFIALEITMRLVCGLDWFGKPMRPRDVIYIAGEGAAGIGKRIEAWCDHNNIEELPPNLLILPMAVNLMDPKETERLVKSAKHEAEQQGFQPALIIVDTLARAMVGADENSSQDMGRAINAGADIQRELNCTFLPVHHTGKNVEMGMRGSSALFGASDTVLKVTRGEEDERHKVTLMVEKQKDDEDGTKLEFETKLITLPPKHGLIMRTSLVLIGMSNDFKRALPSASERPDEILRKMANVLGPAGKMSFRALGAALGFSGRRRVSMAGLVPFYPDYLTVDLGDHTCRLNCVRDGEGTTAAILVARSEVR